MADNEGDAYYNKSKGVIAKGYAITRRLNSRDINKIGGGYFNYLLLDLP